MQTKICEVLQKRHCHFSLFSLFSISWRHKHEMRKKKKGTGNIKGYSEETVLLKEFKRRKEKKGKEFSLKKFERDGRKWIRCERQKEGVDDELSSEQTQVLLL